MTEKEVILNAIFDQLPWEIYSKKLDIEFSLWNNDEMEQLNDLHEIEHFLPGYYGLGSNGGSHLLAIDLKTGTFYSIPFIPMKKSEKKMVAETFKDFLKLEV